MSIQILDIVLYSHDGKKRTLSLNTGEVNVITGKSKSGKSALIAIVDYCLGSGKCNVPHGIIRKSVSWFGLRIKLASGQGFVARRCPSKTAESSEDCYIEVGGNVDIPDFDILHQNTNTRGVISTVSGWSGISENIHIPPEGQTRKPLAATVRHGLMLCFQPQDEIIRRAQLFHGADDHWKAQSLKDALPYFLGAVEDDYVHKQEQLRRLTKELRTVERKIAGLVALRGEGIGKAGELLAQARAVGLSTAPELDDWEEIVSILKEIASTPLIQVEESGSGSGFEEYERLSGQRQDLLAERRHLKTQIDTIRSLGKAESGFATEAQEQQARLISIGIFEESNENICPLCSLDLGKQSPNQKLSDIKASLRHIGEQLDCVSRNAPHIEKAIADIEDKTSQVNEKLRQNRDDLNSGDKKNYENCLSACADYFGEKSREYRLLKHGIVMHHGKMPQAMSGLLIKLIKNNIINIVIATSTLSEGVNLPVETVLIPTLVRYPDLLSAKEFSNLIGRAGQCR